MKPTQTPTQFPARRLGVLFGLTLALTALGCANNDSGSRPQQTAPPDRNIATPTGVVGQGGLPPQPSLPFRSK